MDDSKIVQLYWDRSQDAIPATSARYGSYCAAIAGNILISREDAEECVNDTWLNAWNSMPPHRPAVLSVFLGKITRNLSVNRYKQNHADKRGSGEMALVLDELADMISGGNDTEQEVGRKELIKEVNEFLGKLPSEKRSIFICRYWYADSISKIAKQFGMTDSNVSVTLSRVRKRLKTYLTERGYEL